MRVIAVSTTHAPDALAIADCCVASLAQLRVAVTGGGLSIQGGSP
jgi:hypothetical protein